MIDIILTQTQVINNKANARQDFTSYLNKNKGRYIVSVKNLYTGTNPSTCFDLITRITETVEKNTYDSIGGWMDPETTVYFLDANIHFDSLSLCIANAELYGELAIYDSLNDEVIML